MKNRIIATIVGVSMMLTCSPVFALDNTVVKHVNNVKLEDKSTELSFKASNSEVFKTNLKLGKPAIKFNENSLKNVKEKVKFKSNLLVADNQTTTGSAVTINDSPSNAYTIDIGNVCSDTITSEGGERWYAFENSSIQKLTVITQTSKSNDIDYNLFLFKYNEQTNNLDLVADSLYPNTANEQLSTIGQQGIYFIGVNSIKGFDDKNPFNFAIISSDKYGENEPDDNIFQAKSHDGLFSIEDTIDNNFDQDWSEFTITEPSSISASLTNVNSSNAYKADIIRIVNNQLQLLGTIDINSTGKYLLTAGSYYVRIRTNGGFDTQQKYKFDLKSNKILGLSPDGKYVVTTDSNKNLYINGNLVNVDWERKFEVDYPGGGYLYRDQHVYKREDSTLISAKYGTYTSSYTGTIDHAFNLTIDNPQYFYYYTHNYNQEKPSEHETVNEPTKCPVSLIINADNGQVVDLNENDLNFYYRYNIESHKFQ